MARLRRLIAELADEAPLTRSELERLFLDLVRRPACPSSRERPHRAYEVDFHWPEHIWSSRPTARVPRDPVAFRRDRGRDLDLELAGWHVLRSAGTVVHDPDRVVALLRRRLVTG